MRRAVRLVIVAALLIGLGWALGTAQTIPSPQFELIVTAPAGETTVTCRSGCELGWIERGINPNAKPQSSFTFDCSDTARPCVSGRIGGWVKR